MTQEARGRLTSTLAHVAVLVMLAALPLSVTVPRTSAASASTDSNRPAAAHADSGHAAPARTAPNDAVHKHPAPAPAGHAASGPKPIPLKIVVPRGSPRVLKVTLGIRHRVFPDFAEKSEAVMGKSFQIGDTRFSATVTHFEPDFVIDPTTHSITSRSSEPKNPAFRLIVREQGVPQDTTWAFLNMAPHFMRNSLLAFEILRIDFVGRPPLLRDSTAFGRSKP